MPPFARLLLLLYSLALSAAPYSAAAQSDPGLTPVTSVSSNTIQVLAPAGDSLWLGPFLTVYLEDEGRFLFSQQPRLQEDGNVVFALDAAKPAAGSPFAVWSSLAFDTGNGTPGAGGFLVSTDGGQTFAFQPDHLDAVGDTTVRYGSDTFPAIPATQPANNAVQSLDVDPGSGTVWIAGNQSGIRRSADGGATWTRAVLPPDTSRSIAPNATPRFPVGAPVSQTRGSLNHIGLSVLVDEAGTVWAGTANGINRSDASTALPSGSRAWVRTVYDGTPDGLTGNTVIALAEQPRADARNPIWMATWPFNQTPSDVQRFGATVTEDGGQTFRQTLVGEQVFGFAFRGETAYAAAESGLHVSDDGGATWRTVRTFRLQDEAAFLRDDAEPRSVATTDSALWVGTTDGLLRLHHSDEAALRSDDLAAPGPAWQLFRTDVPVNPEQPSDAVPDVATYAYPNPFSPSQDEVVRIRYELDARRSVTVEIYDFGMNRVRTLRDNKPAGQHETVWDGTDARGLRLPNGTYFYTVETGSGTERGKILLVE